MPWNMGIIVSSVMNEMYVPPHSAQFSYVLISNDFNESLTKLCIYYAEY